MGCSPRRGTCCGGAMRDAHDRPVCGPDEGPRLVRRIANCEVRIAYCALRIAAPILDSPPRGDTVRLPRPLDPALPLDPTTQQRVTAGLAGPARRRADAGLAGFSAMAMPGGKDEAWGAG